MYENDVDENEVEMEESEEEPEEIEEEIESEEDVRWGYCSDHGWVKAVFKGKRWRCPQCGRIVSTKKKRPARIRGEVRERVAEPEEIEEEIEEEKYEDEFTKEAIKYLRRNLARVPGISRDALKRIIETLEFDPNILRNPTLLHMHIKSLAKQANVYYLSMVINKMFMELQPLLEEPEIVYYPWQQQGMGMPMLGMSGMGTGITGMSGTPGTGTPGMLGMPITYNPERKRKRKVYRVVVDGQVIETEDYQEFLEIKRWLDERKKEELERRKLEEQIKAIAKERSEDKESEGRESKEENEQLKSMMSTLENIQRQLSMIYEEKSKLESKLEEFERKEQERELRELKKKAEEWEEFMKNPWKFVAEMESQLSAVGYTRTGKSILDVAEGIAKNVHQTVNTLIHKLPGPKHSPVRYTEEERKERLEQVKNIIKSTEDYVEAEEQLIRAAERVYGGVK